MWIQLDDDALRKAEQILREADEVNSADRIRHYLERAEQNKELYNKFRDTARRKLSDEDDVDCDAIVSISDDPGAYVMCWLWVCDEDAGIEAESARIEDSRKRI